MKIKRNYWIIFWIFCLIAVYYIFFQDSGYMHRYYLKKERKKLDSEIEKISEEIKVLKLENEKLKSDTLQIESFARDNFKMVKPGEITVIIKDNSKDTR